MIADFIRLQISTLRKEMDELAHGAMRKVASQADYLISIGKYREMQRQLEKLTKRLKSTNDDRPTVSRPGDDHEEIEDEEEEEEPSLPPRRIRAKPRQWGAG